MSDEQNDWEIAPKARPRTGDYQFPLNEALSSVVAVEARVPEDAFTAETLGVERAGNGVVIREDGIILTIGYLVTEADEVTLTTNAGQSVSGHVLGYDQASGFGLVQALDALDAPAIKLGDSRHATAGDPVVIGGAGGRRRSMAARILARQEFAGYWEYLIEEAIFCGPAHPYWGGAALIGAGGDLLGVGSLQLQHKGANGRPESMNMIVPIELLTPVYDDLLAGRPGVNRPWLGVYAEEVGDSVVIVGVSDRGPAKRAGLEAGDVVRAVGEMPIINLADFYRSLWALGPAGVDAPLTLERDGDVFDLKVATADRRSLMKRRRLH